MLWRGWAGVLVSLQHVQLHHSEMTPKKQRINSLSTLWTQMCFIFTVLIWAAETFYLMKNIICMIQMGMGWAKPGQRWRVERLELHWKEKGEKERVNLWQRAGGEPCLLLMLARACLVKGGKIPPGGDGQARPSSEPSFSGLCHHRNRPEGCCPQQAVAFLGCLFPVPALC